jgi:branched-chain amino acid transport system ATP-binding protein
MSRQSVLKVTDLKVNYGAIEAVKGISFEIFAGEIVSLIGANGAGKTTTLRALSGLLPSSGQILLNGKSTARIPAYKLINEGLIQSPEGRGIFLNLTVEENLVLGTYRRKDTKNPGADMEHCFQLFPRLKERLKASAGTLSGGEQQMLSISRAILSKPKILMLDEPSLGLAPRIVQQIFQIIRTLNGDGMTILLVEQNARMALKVSHRAYVLETGKICLSGEGRQLLADPEIQAAYLGGH